MLKKEDAEVAMLSILYRVCVDFRVNAKLLIINIYLSGSFNDHQPS